MTDDLQRIGLADGPWSGVREMQGCRDQRLVLEESREGGGSSRVARVVKQSSHTTTVTSV